MARHRLIDARRDKRDRVWRSPQGFWQEIHHEAELFVWQTRVPIKSCMFICYRDDLSGVLLDAYLWLPGDPTPPPAKHRLIDWKLKRRRGWCRRVELGFSRIGPALVMQTWSGRFMVHGRKSSDLAAS